MLNCTCWIPRDFDVQDAEKYVSGATDMKAETRVSSTKTSLDPRESVLDELFYICWVYFELSIKIFIRDETDDMKRLSDLFTTSEASTIRNIFYASSL